MSSAAAKDISMASPFFSPDSDGGIYCRSAEGTYLDSETSHVTTASDQDQSRTTTSQDKCRPGLGSCELANVSHILPSLYPCYFPYTAQHVIFTTTQTVLEACCFEFSRKVLPDLVQEQGWDCALAVDLGRWTRLLNDSALGRIQLGANISEIALQNVLAEVRNLRDAAVDRVPTPARSVSRLLRFAQQLATILGDNERAIMIENTKKLVDNQIYNLEQHKKSLESTVCRKLHSLIQQHAELSQQKAAIISSTRQLDMEKQIQAGEILQSAIEELPHSFQRRW